MPEARAPPKRSKPATPSEDPTGEVLREWKSIFKQYVIDEGLGVSAAYQRIANEYGTTRGTVYLSLNEGARTRHNRHVRKTRKGRDRKPESERSTLRSQIRRHPDHYLRQAFKTIEEPLSLDQITLRIGDTLEEEAKPRIVFRNPTLLKCVRDYENEHNTQLLEEVEPGLYRYNDQTSS